MFEIAETAEFQRCLAALPADEQRRISKKLAGYTYPMLRLNPFSGPNVKRLTSYSPATWRYRIGPYRIFYEIHRGVVFITAIQRRRDTNSWAESLQ